MASNKYDNLWKVLRENTFNIDPDSIKYLKCAICKNLIKNARQSECGCQYCYSCIAEYLGEEDKCCPGGTDDCIEILTIEDVKVNLKINNKISKLKVKCKYQRCDLEVELMNMLEHLRICPKQSQKCQYIELGCEYGEVASRDEICNHLNVEMFEHSKIFIDVIQIIRNEISELQKVFDIKIIEELRIKDNSIVDEIRRLKEDLENWKNLSKSFQEEVTALKSQMTLKQEEVQNERKASREREGST